MSFFHGTIIPCFNTFVKYVHCVHQWTYSFFGTKSATGFDIPQVMHESYKRHVLNLFRHWVDILNCRTNWITPPVRNKFLCFRNNCAVTDWIIASIYTFQVELPRNQVQGREPCAMLGNTSKEKVTGDWIYLSSIGGGVCRIYSQTACTSSVCAFSPINHFCKF